MRIGEADRAGLRRPSSQGPEEKENENRRHQHSTAEKLSTPESSEMGNPDRMQM